MKRVGEADDAKPTRYDDDAVHDGGRQDDDGEDEAADTTHDGQEEKPAVLELSTKKGRRQHRNSTAGASCSGGGQGHQGHNNTAGRSSRGHTAAKSPTHANADPTTATSVDPRERHKLAERERRKSMRELFLSLHELLPNKDQVRKEQSAILDEIIKYIPSAVSRLRSLQMDPQRRRRVRRRLDIPQATPAAEATSMASSSSNSSASMASASSESSSPRSCSSVSPSFSSSSHSSSDNSEQNATTITSSPPNTSTAKKRLREESNSGVLNSFYACSSRGSTNCLTTLAAASPNREAKRSAASVPRCSSMPSFRSANGGQERQIDIRVGREPASSVSIRQRGDRVNLSLTEYFSSFPSSLPPLLLSAVMEELDAHKLDLVRSTHCRDGSKLLHYSESKIRPTAPAASTPGGPPVVMDSLQHLAAALHSMRKRTTGNIPGSSDATSPCETAAENSEEATPRSSHKRKHKNKGNR